MAWKTYIGRDLKGGNMTILTLIILSVLTYGFVRFMYRLIQEIKEFCIEAWRDVEI